ncbi:MAG TPA: RNA-binding protein [Candidatus Nanoarchaeia archaeon]|nr:RNA-binding protein [Candidatus Nanoarchaeia archaeon]
MKIYVGNLPFSMTDKDLNTMFATYGQVTEAVIIKDKFSGRSKGFGFVTFADKAAGEKAIAEMNGKDMQGRAITVNEARPMEPRTERPQRSGGFRSRY